MAYEITEVAVRKSGTSRPSISVVPPVQDDHPVAPTITASLAGAGFAQSEGANPLRYYISKLYGGILLRVEYLGEWTAAFFRVKSGELVGAGPLTVQRKG